jgi:hypothetical protein
MNATRDEKPAEKFSLLIRLPKTISLTNAFGSGTHPARETAIEITMSAAFGKSCH